MSSRPDWLPKNHEALFDKAMLTANYITVMENRNRMGFAADTVQGVWLDTVFVPSYGAFKAAFVQWQHPSFRTKILTVRLREREAAFKQVYRRLYTGLLKGSPLVTDMDLQSMGLPLRYDGSRRPAAVAKKAPECRVMMPGPGRLVFHYYSGESSHRRAKPDGQHGVEIRWAILDAPVVDLEDLSHSVFATRPPVILDFDWRDRGKMLYYCLCWENTRGQKGIWGHVFSVIIP
ncbi:MAG: hypothetical protein LBF19_04300 [Prevotellaceae bacterium]|jgi:hypothetical protein|nr:hypothetical protein [Prevotellaceae bacterium]